MDYSDSRMVSEGRVLIEVLNWPPLVCGLTHRTENRVASRILNPTLPSTRALVEEDMGNSGELDDCPGI